MKSITVSSPGRINIIGEHTDYNDGFVLPCAIDKRVNLKLIANGSKNRCTIKSKGFNSVLIADLNFLKPGTEGWHNYVLGVLYEIKLLTQNLQGFDCNIETNVPVGSGVSSSAALECGLAFGLNELFALGLDKWQLIKLGQRAEHNFVGTQCGIMDQFSTIMGKKGNCMLLDCLSLEFEYVPTYLDPYVILMLNTNVTHNLSVSSYNTRRKESATGLSIISERYAVERSFRNITFDMVMETKKDLGDIGFRRCSYILEENQRVLKAATYLKNSNLHELGKLLYESHEGQREKYEVSCPELDYLVELSKEEEGILGSRMVGGGFGGCTLNLIHKDFVTAYIEKSTRKYKNKFGIKLTNFVTFPSQGTSIISDKNEIL